MKAYVLLLSLLLAGCSALDLINPLSGGGVNSNAQVGKENTQQVVGSQIETTTNVQGNQTNSQVSGSKIGDVQINEVPLWIILLAILGWMLPTPTNMWNGFVKALPWNRRKRKPRKIEPTLNRTK
jgi:hypothetical protein